MINSIKNNITTRKGFIIAVITLILFNFVFIGGYYTIHLSNEINDHHTEIREELTKEVDNLKKIISKSNTPQKELQQYAIKNNVTITITNDNNEIILTYKPNKQRKLGSDITVSKIVSYQEKTYLLTISKKLDIIDIKVIVDFFAFELLIIAILGSTGILGANKKILEPLTQLSKDFSKYKLGILPKKRKLRSGVDYIQNDFVDLVDKLEEEKSKQNMIIASISHDIKTPLTSILGYSELANKESTNPKTKEKYLNTIYYYKSYITKHLSLNCLLTISFLP